MNRPAADSTEVPVIDLKPFCAVSDIRQYMLTPFVVDGQTIATNGQIMIRVQGVDPAANQDAPIAQSVRALFEKVYSDFVPLPTLPKAQKCRLCKGAGFIEDADCEDCDGRGEFMHGVHIYECQNCDGTGTTGRVQCRDSECDGGFVREPVKIGDATFSARYLRLIAALPNARICTDGPQGTAAFVFDGGDGRLMPMRLL